jgi:hypothetical protein
MFELRKRLESPDALKTRTVKDGCNEPAMSQYITRIYWTFGDTFDHSQNFACKPFQS